MRNKTRFLMLFGIAAFSFIVSSVVFGANVIRVISDRTESNVKPLLEQFEKTSGIKVNVIYVDQGLVNRLEANPTEADVVITKDSDLLAVAANKKLLQAFSSDAVKEAVPDQFRDKKNQYFIDAYRARIILYSKDRVKPEQLSTYEDLATVKWKGKVCMRSGYHDYNVSLFGQMLSKFGPKKAKEVISGFHTNLAREPKGNDREQAKGIYEGKCDVALVNTYYYPLMFVTPEQKPWADATNVFFPNQKDKGTFVLSSALALTKAKGNIKEATKLLEFFAGPEGQTITANITFQYPVNKAVQPHELLKKLGEGQKEIKDGMFKINVVSPADIAKQREAVVKLLNEIGFDKL